MSELRRTEDINQDYPSAFSGSGVIPPARNTVTSETDSFNQPWGASRIIEPKNIQYRISFNPDSPEWIHNIVNKLNRFLAYEENWDSYGAEVIDLDSTKFVMEMLKEIIEMGIPEPSIVPGSDGGIQMEWHMKDTHLEIKMMPDRSVEYSFDDERNDFEEKEDEFVFYRTQLPENFLDCVNDFLMCVNNR